MSVSKSLKKKLSLKLFDALLLICTPFLGLYIEFAKEESKAWIAFFILAVIVIRISKSDGGLDLLLQNISSKKEIVVSKSKKPSQLALLFAGMLQGAEDREALLGCLEERFRRDVKRRGFLYANCMLWRDNLEALWDKFGSKAIKVSKWAGLSYLAKELVLYLFHYFQK